MSEELVVAKPIEAQSNKLTRLAAFTPTNLTEAVALAKLIASSDLAPKDYKGKPGNVLIAMQLGAELGIAPMQAIQNVAVINGRPSVWGDLMLALVQAHPDYEAHKEFMEGTGDGRKAIFQIKRRGQEWHQQAFTVQDAKVAGLWGKIGPWKTNPDRMLAMRARGFGLRDKFADALKGLKLAEEAMDMPPDKPTRESGTLDVNREMATMTASSEPNRGHGNEGMVQAPTLSKAPGMDQTAKAQDETICGDCHEKNGKHKSDCFYADTRPNAAAQKALDATKESNPTQTTPESRKGSLKLAVKIEGLKVRTKAPLRTLSVVSDDGTTMISCWHDSLIPVLDEYLVECPALAVLEVTQKTKDGKVWTNLERILEIDGVSMAEGSR